MKTNAPDPGPAPKTRRRAFRGELAALKDGPLSVLRERATALGFRCLSDSWTDYHSHYRFECAVGHQFDRTATTVLYGDGGCLACKRDALAELWLAKVAAKGGALVQGSFTGMLDRYRLRCAAGHEWEAQGRKISEGSWCPACGRESAALRKRLPDGLARLHAAAMHHGGTCEAIEYTDGSQRYPFECADGHRWEAKGSEIIKGSWCKICACAAGGQANFYEDGLAKLQSAAQKHGGECLSREYLGSDERHRFRCAAGHEWEAVASQIWLGHWCRTCGNLKRRLTIEEMQSIAAERGGVCLSNEYRGKDVKLTWQCHRGHTWDARPLNVKARTWCPSCAILDRIQKRNSWKRMRYQASSSDAA